MKKDYVKLNEFMGDFKPNQILKKYKESKVEEITNKELIQFVFHTILNDSKFKPYHIEIGDTYFIFNRGENSIAHFRVFGVNHHWKFGLWVDKELISRYIHNNGNDEEGKDIRDYPIIELFTQYDTHIDKFKPSASDMKVSISIGQFIDMLTGDSIESDSSFGLGNIVNMLKMIRRHPFMCYDGYCLCGDFSKYSIFCTESLILRFLKMELSDYMYKMRKKFRLFFAYLWAYPLLKVKVIIANRSPLVKECRLVNLNKEDPDFIHSEKYTIYLEFKSECVLEEYENGSIDVLHNVTKIANLFKRGKWGSLSKYKWSDYFARVSSYIIEDQKGCFPIND